MKPPSEGGVADPQQLYIFLINLFNEPFPFICLYEHIDLRV